MLWLLRGWPARSALFLHTDLAEGRAAAEQFRDDSAAFDRLQGMLRMGKDVAWIEKRSVFHLLPVQQILVFMKSTNFEITPPLRSFLQQKHARFLQSQLAEDGFNIARQVETGSGNKRSPCKTIYTRLANAKVLGERHHFQEVRPDAFGHDLVGRSIPQHAFAPALDAADPPFHEVVSSSPVTPWWTCKADQAGAPFADLALLQFAQGDASGQVWDSLDNVWLTKLLLGRNMVVRCKTPIDPVRPHRWYFTLSMDVGSATLLWPASCFNLEGDTDAKYFCPDPSHAEWAAIVDLDQWEAMRFQWRSPA